MAGFSFAELRQAGFEWHDLAIQCHATYSELIAAGYEKGKDALSADHQLLRSELHKKSSKSLVAADDDDGKQGGFEASLRG